MGKNKFLNKVSGALCRAGFTIQKHSPEVLVVTGVVGVLVGTVMACKATIKLGDILSQHKENLDKVREVAQDETLEDQYTVLDEKRDRAVIHVQTGVKIARLYAPAFAVTALSITGILASHDILHKRSVAIAAAYATVDKSFKDYQERVVKRFGERVDAELKHGIKAVEVSETTTDEKTGEPKEVKKTLNAADSDISASCSPYARYFDKDCKYWDKSYEYNMSFLVSEQQYANDRLRAKGHLFLNEVYDRLGLPRTKAGQAVGWVYAPKDPKHLGDNYVDFGITPIHTAEYPYDDNVDDERRFLLDFNVDGPIMETVLEDI